ncbi:zinc finger protein 287-like [Zerene cesonia]|uniref:zinc finger protein 287-like n=1 Tax=Zerene cesonia TaxID=33412 RepID=UPI0018E4F17A|nr:zinc finger protein 287-like [Zerene cesonia]
MWQVRLNKLDENSFDMLKRKGLLIQCEFCDKTFNNRYASIIHNSYHIVIPLIKQELYRCPDCLFYFQSINKLQDHKTIKHKDKTVNIQKIKVEPGAEYQDIFLPLPFVVNSDCVTEFKTKYDDTEEYILPDVCNREPIRTSPLQACDSEVPVVEPQSLSIHYDQLTQPGIYRCKYCEKQFINKFQSIEHETTHMRFKKGRPLLCTICDMYIAGNHWQLRKHVEEKHPHRTNRPRSKTLCTMCGLKYHKYIRHLINYHPNTVENLNNGEAGLAAKTLDVNLPNGSQLSKSVFNICQGCMPFLKKKINLKYVIVGSVHEMGVRHKCAKCNRMFFEITLVQRIKREVKAVDKLNFEDDMPKRKPPSNEERLRNIQMRLKMINKLSKF